MPRRWAGSYARLDVEDTGSGIPAEIVGKIFDPFFTTREEEGGTGLGLATSYGLLSAAGGALSVESEVGKGTTFTILLPEVHGEAVELPEDSAETALRGSERILVAEDEDRLQSLLVEVLESAGYQVTSVGNGPAALEAMGSSERPRLLITDVVMPGMSGVELIHEARAMDPSLRVLTMSGYRRDEDVPDTGLPEELAFLAKPFTPRELLVRVRGILDLPESG